MPQDPQAAFDQSILEMIEHSPVGAVPATPAYQDALRRLLDSHQVYASADHAEGYVTVRSLALQPCFHAANLEALAAGTIDFHGLEPDGAIFDRYLAALPGDVRARAETYRQAVVGRAIHHRKHAGVVAQDPVHTLFLVPGTGTNPGLPGNYVFGSLRQLGPAPDEGPWAIEVHDRHDGAASSEIAVLADAIARLQELIASMPFHLEETPALGFQLN